MAGGRTDGLMLLKGHGTTSQLSEERRVDGMVSHSSQKVDLIETAF